MDINTTLIFTLGCGLFVAILFIIGLSAYIVKCRAEKAAEEIQRRLDDVC